MDTTKTPSQRADALVAAMTQEQKLSMLTFGDPPWFTYFGTAGHIDGIPELCLPDLVLADAGSGVAGAQALTTVFPSGIAQASTFNPALQRKFGAAVGREAFRKGINVMLAPGMNIARTPLNGRNFEYFGEDPWLASRTAVSVIKGIQDNPVLADAKHYAASNQETDRQTVDARVDERTLREIYLPAFEASVKEGQVGSVMCAYNKVNGPWACENPTLLTKVLREDWGFDGFVVSDWGAVHSTVDSANAGLDLEMNAVAAPVASTGIFGAGGRFFGPAQLQAAVDERKVAQARIDDMVRNIVRPMFKFGLFEQPVPEQVSTDAPYVRDVSTPQHRQIAREVGAEGSVLLKNRDGLLPFAKATGRTIAVIGHGANPVGATNQNTGGGSSHGTQVPPVVSPLEGIQRQAAANGDRVVYVDGTAVEDARAAAAAADIAVVVGVDGNTEIYDRPDLGLRPQVCVLVFCQSASRIEQEPMIAAVTKANPNSVVVLNIGAPVRMPWLKDAGAVLVNWYAGVEQGNTIASLLYGEAEPSGRLPYTFPTDERQIALKTKEQYPGVGLKADYSEGLLVGYRWYDAKDETPLFPFGFGLGWSSFAYEGLTVDGKTAKVTVRNTGKRTSAAVPQVYVTHPASTGEPPLQLKGFRKVTLDPGEARTVEVDLDPRAFAQWSTAANGWREARGCYEVLAGASSRDLPLSRTVGIGGARCDKAPVRCASRRSFTIRLPKAPKGTSVRRATVTVAGKRVKVRTAEGRRVATVDLRGQARRTVTVKVRQRLSDGRLVTQTRRFRPCRPGTKG